MKGIQIYDLADNDLAGSRYAAIKAFGKTMLATALVADARAALELDDNLADLTAAEVAQLENIGTNTISADQWAYVGQANQNVRTTDAPLFKDLTILDNGSDAVAPFIKGMKIRGSSVVQDNDDLLSILATAYDGDTYAEAAQILMEVDGTPGDADMPGRIVFLVTPDGAEAVVEALRITNAGILTFADAKDIAFNTTTGTKIGTATDQKIGFFNATPVVQPTEITDELTALTHTAPGTPDYALQDLVQPAGYGFVSKDEGNTALSVIVNNAARIKALEDALVSLGLLADAD